MAGTGSGSPEGASTKIKNSTIGCSGLVRHKWRQSQIGQKRKTTTKRLVKCRGSPLMRHYIYYDPEIMNEGGVVQNDRNFRTVAQCRGV
jgi:hypothetical protein